MRFSEIKNNPLDYNKQTVIDKLKEYFTIKLTDNCFDNYLNVNQINITLEKETTKPITVTLNVTVNQQNPQSRIFSVDLKQIEQLYDDSKTRFTDEFLLKLMRNEATNNQFKNNIQNIISNIILENITNCTSLEIRQLFGLYIEDNIKNPKLAKKLNFNYFFWSKNKIEINIDKNRVTMRYDIPSAKWILFGEFPQKHINAFRDDIKTIRDFIEKQPNELKLTINKKLPRSITPYLNLVEYVPFKHNYNDVQFDLLPVQLTYNNKQLTITCLIEKYKGLQHVQKVLDYIKNNTKTNGFDYNIETLIKNACIPDMVNDKINKKRDKIIQTLANINKESISFTENNIQYKLKPKVIYNENIDYYRDHENMFTLIKRSNDFKIDFENSQLFDLKLVELEEIINDVVDKF